MTGFFLKNISFEKVQKLQSQQTNNSNKTFEGKEIFSANEKF